MSFPLSVSVAFFLTPQTQQMLCFNYIFDGCRRRSHTARMWPKMLGTAKTLEIASDTVHIIK